MATRSRKGYWRMSANSIVHNALNKKRLNDIGVPELRDIWIKWHYRNTHLAPPKSHWSRPVQPTAERRPAERLPEGRAIARQTRMPGGVGG